MAQSVNFFGLRKGSTKNFTFSTLDGKQITKERVYDVKNPRTEGQMRQRMVMTSVGAAYRYLKVICDHSFEGLTVGQKSMSEFNRLNLNKFNSISKNDAANTAFNAYKDNLINPMPFITSRGSLGTLPYAYNAEKQIYISANAESVATAEDIYNALGIKKNDMITFMWVNGESSLVDGVLYFTPTRLAIVRLRADKTGAVSAPHDAFSFEASENGLDISVTYASGVLTLATSEANFGTAILSRKSNDTWLRSNSAFVGSKQILEGVTVASQFSTYPTGNELILNGAAMGSTPTVETLPTPQLSLSSTSVSISEKGGTVEAPTLSGNDAKGTVTYSSSNKTIATVDASTGVVTAVGNGTAVITVAVGATTTTAAASVAFDVVVTGQDSSGDGSGDDGHIDMD